MIKLRFFRSEEVLEESFGTLDPWDGHFGTQGLSKMPNGTIWGSLRRPFLRLFVLFLELEIDHA